MIFKQIFGKTVDAAMKSAKQIYGDDFTVFHTSEGDQYQKSGISLIVDEKKREGDPAQQRKKEPVYFEKTQKNGAQKRVDSRSGKELHKLRNIAESQLAKTEPRLKSTKNSTVDKFQNKTKFTAVSDKNLTNDKKPVSVYSRKSVRPFEPTTSTPKVKARETQKKSIGSFEKPRRTRGLLSRFDESKPTIDKPEVNKTPFRKSETHIYKEDKVDALHKRFDRLEALLYSELISVNHEYVAHPVFQQLLQTGIPSNIISEWFKRIIDQNIDPFNNSETFAFEISKILKKALISNRSTGYGKSQLFIGFSGSGKTSLIMKLILNKNPLQRKKIAVLSVLPETDNQKNYFTILEPFCVRNEINYYKAGLDSELSEISRDLNTYEEIFIDTPSLSVDKGRAETKFTNIKQLLDSLPDMAIHFTVNVAGNYNDSQSLLTNSGVVAADFIALTHLDEIEEWGPVIPLFEKTKCSGSYLSIGNSLTKSLKYFDAAWLTKNLLEKSD